jgi:ParB family chromosome partitioning protein
MRFSEQETALEQGWLLQELEQRFRYRRRFDRSTSWVSRRLALVEQLPATVRQRVRAGEIAAHVAMRYLVPVARANASECLRMADAFAKHLCSAKMIMRQSSPARIHDASRRGWRLRRYGDFWE